MYAVKLKDGIFQVYKNGVLAQNAAIKSIVFENHSIDTIDGLKNFPGRCSVTLEIDGEIFQDIVVERG